MEDRTCGCSAIRVFARNTHTRARITKSLRATGHHICRVRASRAESAHVARELKYYSPDTDLSQLEKELATSQGDDQYEDKWADYDDAEEESA